MGYAIASGYCLLCRRVFSFNPVKVPSFRVNGTKEPVCAGCMDQVNVKRVELGVPAFEIPADAYEPCDEGELDT
jgi:hypothetical protein